MRLQRQEKDAYRQKHHNYNNDKADGVKGQTFSGSNHDYKIFKDEFPFDAAWFEYLTVLVDLGDLSIIKDYEGDENIHIPFKKPRKSKNHPNPSLTPEQKEYNKELSSIRVLVELSSRWNEAFQHSSACFS